MKKRRGKMNAVLDKEEVLDAEHLDSQREMSCIVDASKSGVSMSNLSNREFIFLMFPCVKEGLEMLSDPEYENKQQTFNSIEEYERHVFGK